MHTKIFLAALALSYSLFLFASCQLAPRPHMGSIASDSLSISKGEASFIRDCSGCHGFGHDGIGPALNGVTTEASVDWIKHFIKNPKKMIGEGDDRATRLFQKYHSMMPSFSSFTDSDLNSIIAFLDTKKAVAPAIAAEKNVIQDAVPEPIKNSGMLLGLRLVTQIPYSDKKQPFARINKLDFQPGTNDLFILDLRGKLYKLKDGKPSVYFDISRLKPKFIHKPGLGTGFGSFAFHPQFAKNGLLYTTHAEPANTQKADFAFDDSIKPALQWVVTEWKTEHPSAFPFKGTSRELFRVNMVSAMHGMQEITFNPFSRPGDEDYGQLYIGIGDGGCVENKYPFLSHSPGKIWGTIIRIDPLGHNSANGNYGIPQNNPFVKSADPKMHGEVYAFGFRNPNRITWSKSGLMLASNIGQAHIEAINIIEAGHDYGWPVREGRFSIHPRENINIIYPLPSNDTAYHISYPVMLYDHDEGNAIAGGFEYTGTEVSSLEGKYIFGDIPHGRLFYAEMADIKQGQKAPVKEWHITVNGKPTTLKDLCGSDRIDLRFGKDANGEIYILTKADGKAYKLVNPDRK